MATSNITSVLQFAQMLAKAEANLAKHTRHVLTECAEMVQEEARGMLGTYQAGNAQFQTWPELADSTKEQRFDLGFPENEPLLRTGELHDHILFEVELHSADSGEAVIGVPSVEVGDGSKHNPHRNIGDVALAQEMGTHTIPARSFLGLAAANLSKEIADRMGHEMTAAIVGDPREATVPRLNLGKVKP